MFLEVFSGVSVRMFPSTHSIATHVSPLSTSECKGGALCAMERLAARIPPRQCWGFPMSSAVNDLSHISRLSMCSPRTTVVSAGVACWPCNQCLIRCSCSIFCVMNGRIAQRKPSCSCAKHAPGRSDVIVTSFHGYYMLRENIDAYNTCCSEFFPLEKGAKPCDC